MVVTSIPVAIGYLFGRYVLKTGPVLLAGGITGSMTSGAAPEYRQGGGGSQESDANAMVTQGAYVFANVWLTMAGSAILLLWEAGTAFAVLLVLLIAAGSVGVG